MKVLVIGAGPVGLTMASELARRGVSVRIIDKSHAPSQLSKALAVHARMLEVFEQMGAVDAFLTRGWRVSGMTAWLGSDNRTAEVNLANLDSPYPFVLDIPQSVTEEILIQHLNTFAVEVERQVELLSLAGKEDGVTAVLRHSNGREEIVDTGWVVGCDGAHSTVRHQLGASFDGTPYPDLFALADVKIQWSLPQDRIQMFLTTDELVAAFPYGEGRYRLMTSIHPTTGHEMPTLAPTLEWFQQVVDSRCGVAATLSDAVWMDTFHSHLRHAKQTRFGRVFLVGDAAHIHSPAGGQGMNTGIQDAFNLAWKLALVAEGSAVESLLDSYQVERLAVAESVLRLSDGLLRGATSRSRVVKFLRNHLVPMLAHMNVVQERMTGQLAETAIHYRTSPIVAEHFTRAPGAARRVLRAGDRAPDNMLSGGQVGVKRFYDLLSSTKHHLVMDVSTGTPSALVEALMSWGHLLELMVVEREMTVDKSGLSRLNFRVIPDDTGSFAKRYGLVPGSLLLIRPDGYIGYISDTLDASHLVEYLTQTLGALPTR